MKLEDKSNEDLIEQVRRLQDRINALQTGHASAHDAVLKRCADYRKAARSANARADEAERKLRILNKAFAQASDALVATTEDGTQ